MKTGHDSAMAFCPDCEDRIQLNTNPELGLKVLCPYCGAYLEIIRLRPLKLSWDLEEHKIGWRLTKQVVVN